MRCRPSRILVMLVLAAPLALANPPPDLRLLKRFADALPPEPPLVLKYHAPIELPPLTDEGSSGHEVSPARAEHRHYPAARPLGLHLPKCPAPEC